MEFVFNERKAAQAMAQILARHKGRRMNYMVAVKLLYLADRKALVETGRPITGDWMVSLPHGPVLSIVLNLVREPRDSGGSPWTEYVSRHGRYEIEAMKKRSPRNDLSDYEVDVLAEIDARFGSMTWLEIRKWTHDNLPEWRDPGDSSHPIDPESILRAENKSAEEIEQISRSARELWFFGRASQTGR